MESKLVPEAGFDIDFVRSAGLNRVGLRQQAQSLLSVFLLASAAAGALLRKFKPKAIFSMGGYVAGPVMLAAILLPYAAGRHGAECHSRFGKP